MKAGAGLRRARPLVETVSAVNEQRKRAMARKVIAACGGSVRGKTIAVLGLTFKPNTDDMRDAPSIALITALQDGGAKVRAYDPAGHEAGPQHLEKVEYADDAYACMEGADALVHGDRVGRVPPARPGAREKAAQAPGSRRPAQRLSAPGCHPSRAQVRQRRPRPIARPTGARERNG